MEKGNYSPRFIIILLIALVVGQLYTVNYLQKDFQRKIMECYQAINTNSLIQGAIVNLLEKKNIVDRNQLMQEAENLSSNVSSIIDKMKASEQEGKAPVKDND